jgi:alkyl hydroperoxide reductase subunit AhpF
MVHLVVSLSAINPRLSFRIVQVDQFLRQARAAGVLSTPTLMIPGQSAKSGNLPSTLVAFYLWQAATQNN